MGYTFAFTKRKKVIKRTEARNGGGFRGYLKKTDSYEPDPNRGCYGNYIRKQLHDLATEARYRGIDKW